VDISVAESTDVRVLHIIIHTSFLKFDYLQPFNTEKTMSEAY